MTSMANRSQVAPIRQSGRASAWTKAVLLVSVYATLTAGDGSEKPPEAESQAAVREVLRQAYRKEYKDRSHRGRWTLARKLIEHAEDDRQSSDTVFVALDEARRVAADAGDVTLFRRAGDALTSRFAIDRLQDEPELLAAAAKRARQRSELIAAAEHLLKCSRTLVEREDFKRARAAATSAGKAAARARHDPLAAFAKRHSADLKRLERSASEVARVRKRDSSKSRSTVGEYMCSVLGDWKDGLEVAAQGAEGPFESLAKRDLARPRKNSERAALADAWWELAQKYKGMRRTRLFERAAHWYDALTTLPSGKRRRMLEARHNQCLREMKALERAVALDGASENNGHLYRAFSSEKPISWNEAKQRCEAMGGYLTCVETRTEQDFLAKLAISDRVWAGGTDVDAEGKWCWINGSPFTFKNWYRGEPNNSSSVEHYVCFDKSTGRWNDAHQGWDEVTGFICEWE